MGSTSHTSVTRLMTQCTLIVLFKCPHHVHSFLSLPKHVYFSMVDRNIIISLWIYRPLIVDVNKSCIFQVQLVSFPLNWACLLGGCHGTSVSAAYKIL